MAVDTIDATLDEIDKWAARRGVYVNRGDIRQLLELSRDHLAHQVPTDLELGDLDELLLDVYPDHVDFEKAADAEDVIRAASDLLDFLGDTDRLPENRIAALDQELDEVGPEFLEAVLSPEEAAELLEPEYDLVAVLEQLGFPTDDMPPMRLPARAELAESARQSKLLQQARLLGAWADEGQELTDDGDPTPEGIASAAAAAGIAVQDVKGFADAPEVALLVQLAEFAGFISSTEDVLRSGQSLADWPGGDDDTVIHVWQAGLAVTLGYSLDWLVDVHDGEIEFEGVAGTLFLMLFLSRDIGVPMSELSDMVQNTSDHPEMLRSWIQEHGDPAETLVGRLAELGAVVVDDDVVRLTPLGAHTMRDQLMESGVLIPLLPPAAEMTAEDLIAVTDSFSEAEMEAELTAWLAHRSPLDAARQLLAAAAESPATSRIWVSSVVTDLGAGMEPVWRSVLDTQALRPYAKIALARIAGHEPPGVPAEFELDQAELGWLALDTLSVTVVSSEEVPQALAAVLPAGREEEMLNVMWRLPHEDVVDLLNLIGRLHPDKKVAKHARKVAHKAATFHPQG